MQSNTPKISVIIPVYNVEKYLQPCIDSLIGQTLEDMELIFVNDASPDNCLSILQHNQQQHPDKIRIIDSKVNLRQGGARNLGIAAARAPYIGFLDSDDFAAPDMYEHLYSRMLETDADVVFTQYAAVPEDATLESVTNAPPPPSAQWPNYILKLDNVSLNETQKEDLIPCVLGTVWTGLWKKSLLTESQVFFPEHLRYEDNYFCSLLRPYTNKIAFVFGVHIYYRQVASSTVNKRNAVFQLDRIKIENMLLDEVKKRGFFEKYHSGWEYIYTTRYAYNSIVIFLDRFDKLPLKEIKQVKNDLAKNFPNWRKNKYLKMDGFHAFPVKLLLSCPARLTLPVRKLMHILLMLLKKVLGR